MGVRKDLDSAKTRYVYLLLDEDDMVLYVGTAVNPKQRYKTHLKKSQTENSDFYKYVRENNVKFRCKVVKKITGTYQQAEQEEIEMIRKHSDTCLNFYNNPNRKKKNK